MALMLQVVLCFRIRQGSASDRTAMSSTCCRVLTGIQVILPIIVGVKPDLQVSAGASVAAVAGFQHEESRHQGESNEFLPVFHI